MRRLRLNEQSGFTLLELLMVVIIIAILAAIALPQYLRLAEKARSTEVLSLMASIRGSENRYRNADPGQSFTQNFSALDIELPGVPPAPGGPTPNVVTTSWTLDVDGTTGSAVVNGDGGGSNVHAVRNAGASTAGAQIWMDLENGNTCSDNPIYGLPAPNAAC